MGKLRHQQVLDVPGSCAILLHPKLPPSPHPKSHQDCENAGVCPSSRPAGSESEDTASVWVLQGREGTWQPPRHIAAAGLAGAGLSHQPGKRGLASCGSYTSIGPSSFTTARWGWGRPSLLPPHSWGN